MIIEDLGNSNSICPKYTAIKAGKAHIVCSNCTIYKSNKWSKFWLLVGAIAFVITTLIVY